MAASGVLLLVLEVAALLGEGDEVREDHAADADVEKGLDGAGLDVLLNVAVHGLVGRLLDVLPRKLRLQIAREIPHPHPLDLVIQRSHRHGRPLRAPLTLTLVRDFPSFSSTEKKKDPDRSVGTPNR